MTDPPTTPTPHTEFFDKAGIQYEEAYSHDAGLHTILEKYMSFLPKGSSLLDCGSGSGKPVAETLVKNNLRVHGIDLSSTMVDLSRKQVPGGTFEIVNMLEYTPPSSTTTKFNGVVAMYSLFVLSREQITRMAGNWFQWLEPGRYLLIGVIGAEDFKNTSPEKFDADGQCATGVPHMFMNNVVYVTLFTKEGWNKLLENTGFTVVHTETDLFRPPADAVCDDEPHSFVIAQKPSSAYFLFGVGYFERGRGEDGAHREVKGYKGVCEVHVRKIAKAAHLLINKAAYDTFPGISGDMR
ncbi:hypothetical protein MMC14_002838 [Varicellaria rhodocarpa]|nr:hypothetical protein [Varicellaria rhodocarpa]